MKLIEDKVVKTTISLPKRLFDETERIIKNTNETRSAVLRKALEKFIREKIEDESSIKAARIYKEINQESRRLAEEHFDSITEVWPQD